MLGEKDYLPNVAGTMDQCTIDSLDDRVRLFADEHSSCEVIGLEGRDGIEEVTPSLFPLLKKTVLGITGVRNELLVAFTVWGFSICGEEVLSSGCEWQWESQSYRSLAAFAMLTEVAKRLPVCAVVFQIVNVTSFKRK